MTRASLMIAKEVAPRAMATALMALSLLLGSISLAQAQTLDRIRSTGTIKLGYEPNASPFSFKDEKGEPKGYGIALCTMIAGEAGTQLGLPQLFTQWVPLEQQGRFKALMEGTVDLLCGVEAVTLTRREDVSFSIPIFPSGTGAMVSSRAPIALREILINGQPPDRPIWRGSPARTLLEQMTFSPVVGTTSEAWLRERIETFHLTASVVPVQTYEEGIQRILNGSTNVLFGDMPLLLDAATRSDSSGQLIVLPRHFTYEPLALALGRDDENLRLLVDGALSRFYRTDKLRPLFTEWFGEPDQTVVTFFRQTALPE